MHKNFIRDVYAMNNHFLKNEIKLKYKVHFSIVKFAIVFAYLNVYHILKQYS